MPRKELKSNGVTWVHIRKPVGDDFSYPKKLYPFHPIVMEYILSPTLHPAIETLDEHIFLIQHFPIIYRTIRENAAVEVDFLLTKKVLVTVTYRDYPKLDEFFSACEKSEELKRRHFHTNSGFLLHAVLSTLFDSFLGDLDYIEEEITKIEHHIFKAREPKLVEEISHLRRDILDFRRIFLTGEPALALLPGAIQKLLGKNMMPYFNELITTQSKIRHLIENHKETIEALHETNAALLSTHISQIITVLTIFSAVILPLNFLASIWGMNQKYMPLRDNPGDFWIIVGAMFGLAILLIAFFKKRKWI